MVRLLKSLFGGILAFIGNLLSFGKSKKNKGLSSVASAPKAAQAPKVEKPEPAAFFLNADEARGFTSNNGKPSAPAAATLNLPAPKVTTTTPEPTPSPFIQFARRRPGANMSAYLAMAKQVKTSS